MGEARVLQGERFVIDTAADPDAVFAYLTDVTRTPEWRTHLGRVEWEDDGEITVGRRIRVTTSLLWYRNIQMVCQVTEYDARARRFAYEVVEGPARATNTYEVTTVDGHTRVVMQGSAPLDSWYLGLVGPLLKFAQDRTSRGEMRKLQAILEQT